MKPRLQRILAITAGLIILGSTGCHHQKSAAHPLTHIVLQTDWSPEPAQGGFYEARQQGLYNNAGLDVTIRPGSPETSAEQAVASGAAQFGLGSSDQVLVAVSHGLPLVAVAATMQQDPQAIMVHAESPVRTLQDLDGHTIAARPGSIWFQYLVHRFGLTNLHEVPLTGSIANFLHEPNYIQQVFITSEPFLAQQQGAQVRSLLISSTGYQPYRVYFTSRQFLHQHPDVVKTFVEASTQGWKNYLTDPTAVENELHKLNPNMPVGQIQFSAAILKRDRFLTGDGTPQSHLGHMEAARWSLLYQQLLHLNMLAHPFNPHQAYTLQFCP